MRLAILTDGSRDFPQILQPNVWLDRARSGHILYSKTKGKTVPLPGRGGL
jgi:hypothetical protein